MWFQEYAKNIIQIKINDVYGKDYDIYLLKNYISDIKIYFFYILMINYIYYYHRWIEVIVM